MASKLEVTMTAMILAASVAVGCSGDPAPSTAGNGSAEAENEASMTAALPGTADLPPTGSEADIRAWLAEGSYSRGDWACEDAPHAARPPSAHGKNRICSNAALSRHGAGEFPVGAAGVKELYDSTGTRVIGHATYRKVASGGAAAWYWFEVLNGRVVANDLGDRGVAKSVCAGCHEAAGSDADHSGHDFVYTQVRATVPPKPVLARGTLRPKAHPGHGEVAIVESRRAGRVLELTDVAIHAGPALRVLLTKNADPSSQADVDEGFVDLGELQSTTADQEYAIPDSVDLTDTGAVIVHCVDYGVVFNAAALVH